jgi:serine/threonine protein phosphatase PrpC
LICSDGLSRHLSPEDMAKLGGREGCGPRFVDALIEEANRRGGYDNITAVLAVYGRLCVFQRPRLIRSLPATAPERVLNH